MSDMVLQKNPAALITPRVGAYSTATAGGSGDNTAVTGLVIQRSLIDMPMSAALLFRVRATFGVAAATLTLKTVFINDSADGSTFASFLTFTDPGVVLTATAAQTLDGMVMLNALIKGARDYVQVGYTTDLSAANTDTSICDMIWLFAGEDRLPAAA